MTSRADGVSGAEERLEHAVLDLLAQRAHGATICPSEVARQLGGDQWRNLMEPTREAARRLVAAGRVHILQGGEVVDSSTSSGPIRIRLT